MTKTGSAKGKALPAEIQDGRGLERMTDLTRKVVTVPHDKIEERERAYQDKRRAS